MKKRGRKLFYSPSRGEESLADVIDGFVDGETGRREGRERGDLMPWIVVGYDRNAHVSSREKREGVSQPIEGEDQLIVACRDLERDGWGEEEDGAMRSRKRERERQVDEETEVIVMCIVIRNRRSARTSIIIASVLADLAEGINFPNMERTSAIN